MHFIYIFCHCPKFLLMQFQAKYPAHPVGSHEAKIESHPGFEVIFHRSCSFEAFKKLGWGISG